jgi:hypothetical protein
VRISEHRDHEDSLVVRRRLRRRANGNRLEHTEPGGDMSETIDDERDELGEYDVEENREDEGGGGYGASDQGDAGIEGPGDQSGMGEVEDEEDEVGAR